MVLSTRLRVLLVVLVMALGAVGVLGAVGSASPNNSEDAHHRDDKGRTTLTVVGKNPENEVLDLGAQGPS